MPVLQLKPMQYWAKNSLSACARPEEAVRQAVEVQGAAGRPQAEVSPDAGLHGVEPW